MTSIKHIKNISNHFLELEKRVNKVRFARIGASKRLRKKGVIYNTIISIYSILITVLAIVFSIIDLEDLYLHIEIGILNNYQKDSVIILALSSFITILTLFFSNRNYRERAANYQSNYMELTRLLADIQNLMVYYKLQDFNEFQKFKLEWEWKNPKKDLEKRLAKKYKVFADKYASLLTQSENHEDVDYKKACLDEVIDDIASLEKLHFRNNSLENEEANILLEPNGNVKVHYNKNIINLRSKEFEHNPLPAELRALYRKQADYEQNIIEAEWLDRVKYAFIIVLPLFLLYIFKIFGGILEFLR